MIERLEGRFINSFRANIGNVEWCCSWLSDGGRYACAAKTTICSWRWRKCWLLIKVDVDGGCEDDLCYSITIMNCKVVGWLIDKDDLDFTTVVWVNGSWGVEDANSVLDGKSTSWSNLSFKSRRYSNRDVCGYDHSLVWFDYHGVRDIGSDVHAAGSVGRVRW